MTDTPSHTAPASALVTKEMTQAGSDAIDDYYNGTKDAPFEGGVEACYRAMRALDPEILKLQARAEKAEAYMDQFAVESNSLRDDLTAAKQENERLKSALREIFGTDCCDATVGIAAAALEGRGRIMTPEEMEQKLVAFELGRQAGILAERARCVRIAQTHNKKGYWQVVDDIIAAIEEGVDGRDQAGDSIDLQEAEQRGYERGSAAVKQENERLRYATARAVELFSSDEDVKRFGTQGYIWLQDARAALATEWEGRMTRTINLAGDKWDTIASKVVDAAELDDMRGSVIANLCDEIATALRDAFASGDEQATLAERARCVRIAQAEGEVTGVFPEELNAFTAEEVARGAARATAKAIVAAIERDE